MPKEDKIYGLMGFAVKSGNLITGYNNCLNMIPRGKVKLLIMGMDVGDNTKEKMKSKCKTYGIPVIEFGTCQELSKATGKEDKGLFGIMEDGFAKSIMKKYDEIIDEREVF